MSTTAGAEAESGSGTGAEPGKGSETGTEAAGAESTTGATTGARVTEAVTTTTTVSVDVDVDVDVRGTVAPGFEPVADAFVRNFEQRGERGAAVAVYRHGRKVVDLW